jgi:hypothetical protein
MAHKQSVDGNQQQTQQLLQLHWSCGLCASSYGIILSDFIVYSAWRRQLSSVGTGRIATELYVCKFGANKTPNLARG